MARKTKEGEVPRSPSDWQQAVDRFKGIQDQGAAYEKEMMERDGVVSGEDGWRSQYVYKSGEGGRRWDYANYGESEAVEVKSGQSSTADGLRQMGNDEEAVQNGWTVTWHLKEELNGPLMARLNELAKEYPGKFIFDVVG